MFPGREEEGKFIQINARTVFPPFLSFLQVQVEIGSRWATKEREIKKDRRNAYVQNLLCIHPNLGHANIMTCPFPLK